MARTAGASGLLALLTLFAVACDGDPTGSSEPSLYGAWDAVRACGGFTGGCSDIDPPIRVIVRTDSLFIGPTSPAAGAYRIRVIEDDTTSIHGTHDVIERWYDVTSEWRPWFVILQLDADSLVLGDNAIDGFATELVRVRPRQL